MYSYHLSSVKSFQLTRVSLNTRTASSRYLEQFKALGNVSSDLNPAKKALT